MDKTAMVTVDIGRGAEMIARLTDAKLKIAIALWRIYPSMKTGVC